MRREFPVLFVLFACAVPPGTVHEGGLPSAWTYAPDGEAPPPLTAAEVEQGLDEVVAALRYTRPRTATDLFDEAMTHREEACPQYETTGPQTLVMGNCTTSEGWSWYGVGVLSHMRNQHVVIGEIDHFHNLWAFSNGNVRVESEAAGVRYDLLGSVWYRDYEAETGRALSIELWGEFQGFGTPAFDGAWIVEDRAVELYVELSEVDGGWSGTWTAGLSRLPGLVWAFSFDDLAVSPACPQEPTGSIDLQDQAGTWHTVVLDGDIACDGCGVASTGGAEIGVVCADYAPLAVFEVDPWEG